MTAGIHQWLTGHAKPRKTAPRYAARRYGRIVVGIGSAVGALLALGMIESAVSGLR
jgi:hypothetical protein